MKCPSVVLAALIGLSSVAIPLHADSGTTRQVAVAPNASVLLLRASAQLAKASSYQFEGPVTVAPMQSTGQTYTLSGAWKNPASTYQKSSGKSGTAETLLDGSKVYVRATGSLNVSPAVAGQWYVAGYSVPTSVNPFSALPAAASGNSKLTLGSETQVNGKTCWTITAPLDSEAAKAILAGLGVGASVSLDPKATTKATGTASWYVDQASGMLQKASFSGMHTTQVNGKSTVLKVDAQLALKGVNEPVTLPDVSSAKPLPAPPAPR